MKQVRYFDVNKGGNIPNLCLANVTKGYGIPNKYGSAWQAWEHTEQHTEDIPVGLDVPLFYSYTTTIDGVTENYGHINVRLANGTVWSDGNVYPSIDAYLNTHTPQFVGWGESVNDFKVIEGDDMGQVMTVDNAKTWLLYYVGVGQPTPEDLDFASRYLEKPVDYQDAGIIHHPSFVPVFQLKDRIAELEKQLSGSQTCTPEERQLLNLITAQGKK